VEFYDFVSGSPWGSGRAARLRRPARAGGWQWCPSWHAGDRVGRSGGRSAGQPFLPHGAGGGGCGLFPIAATPRPAPSDTPEHAISFRELQARSPRRLLLKRPYADMGGAGSDRLALQPLPEPHPAVKRSPEVTDLRPGAGRPGGAGPGHGCGPVRGGFRALAGNYAPGE